MAATLQGMNLEMTQTKRSKPAASLTKVRLNSSMELSSDLYLNGKMSRKSMQGTKEVDGEELIHEAMEATPLPEMLWLNGPREPCLQPTDRTKGPIHAGFQRSRWQGCLVNDGVR